MKNNETKCKDVLRWQCVLRCYFVPSKTFSQYRTTKKYQNVPGKRFKWYGITHCPYLFNARGFSEHQAQKKEIRISTNLPIIIMKVTF